uniref:MFS transporter n=1 Tax=Povalibacter sp. TaxID=1962978 RepID=UPI002C5FD8AB
MSPAWYRTLDTDARRAFWTTFSGFSLDAMDIQLYAFVLPVLLTAWGLTHVEAGLLATVALTSSALGGWLAGVLADRVGRVAMLKITILWFAVATCLCGLAGDFHQMLIARALQGLGFGGELAVGAVFVAEVAAPQIRGRMVGMAQSGWAVGWGLAVVISTIVLSVLPPDLGWRITFVVGFLPALAVFFFRRRLQEPAAFRSITRRVPWHSIFAGPTLAMTAKGSLLAIGMHGGYWAIATWWPAMLRAERGLSIVDSSGYLAAIIAGSFLGYAFGSWLSDRAGRRVTLMAFAIGGIVLALSYAGLTISNVTLLLLSVPLGFIATGMFSVIGPVLTELYPTELRGSGLGFCYNLGRGVAGVTP